MASTDQCVLFFRPMEQIGRNSELHFPEETMFAFFDRLFIRTRDKAISATNNYDGKIIVLHQA